MHYVLHFVCLSVPSGLVTQEWKTTKFSSSYLMNRFPMENVNVSFRDQKSATRHHISYIPGHEMSDLHSFYLFHIG